MVIRQVTESELLEVCCKLSRFEECTKFVKVNPVIMASTYSKFIRDGVGGIIISLSDNAVSGGLGFIISNDLHSGEKIAVETFWYVLPEFRGIGIKLLDEFEKLAKENSCDNIAMVHLEDSSPEVLERLYKKRGYKLVERHYVRVIQ